GGGEQLRRGLDVARVVARVVDHDIPRLAGQLLEADRAAARVRLVGWQLRIAVAVEVIDLLRERLDLLALAAVEDRDGVPTRERAVDRLGAKKPAPAEDQDPARTGLFDRARTGLLAAARRRRARASPARDQR